MKLPAMIISILVLIVLVGSVLAPICADSSKSGEDYLDVVVLAGQSNAAYNLVRVDAEGANEGVALAETNCYYFGTSAQAVQYAVTPVNSCTMLPMASPSEWLIGGEEPAIAKTISDKTHDDVYVINVAIGGQSVSNFIPGSVGGNWINTVLSQALAQIPSHYTVNYCGWVWIQGESDQTTPVPEYIMDFEKVQNTFSEFGFQNCYLVKTRLHDSGNSAIAHTQLLENDPHVFLGSDAPESFSEANGLLRPGDSLHYSQLGRNVVGEGVGEAIADTLPAHLRESGALELFNIIPLLVLISALLGAVAVIILKRPF